MSDTSLNVVLSPNFAELVYEFVVSDPLRLDEFDKLSQEYLFSMCEYVAYFRHREYVAWLRHRHVL